VTAAHPPSWYEIRVRGRIDDRWAAWFDGMSLEADADGTTVLCGQVVDQAALHGVLARLRDLGIPLVSVTPGHDTTQVDREER
jgi:hypothetical protein